jgi:hypothetical protein
MDEVSYIIGKILAGHERSERAAWGVDCDLAFQVALEAYRVSLAGRELRRIQNGGCPSAGQVCRRISMTRLAGDASIKKRLGPEVIVGPGRRLHAGRVTMETASVDLEGERHFPRVDRFWVHIPYVLLAIPVHRALKPIAVLLKQIGTASLPGADEISQLLFSLEESLRRCVGPFITQPCAAIPQEEPIVDARGSVGKLTREQAVDS